MKTNRLNRVLNNMRRENLAQILVTSTESVYYLTGLWVRPGERLYVLKIDQSGECALYVNHMFALSGLTNGLKLVEFDDADDPVRILAGDLRPGAVGVDKQWPSQFAIRLMEARPGLRLVLGSGPVDEARMCKDEEELAQMRDSSRRNDRATEALIPTLAAGQTEREVGRRYTDLALQQGASEASFAPLICFGQNCAEPHHNTDNTILRLGDAVILDVGLDYNHAMSDMTRTVFLGTASDEQKRVYDIVLRANMAAKAAVRPGVPLREVDRAARRTIEEAGYGPYFLHRTGHGIGLEVHEPPDASATSETIARPGMVFSIEPGIYLAGKFGVRIEDLVAVTEDGCEVLNSLDREPRVV